MRIIRGTAKGKRLLTPKGMSTRPVLDGVRESVFNILESEGLEEKRVLDLFAGTGSLGLEALSRGAARCVFVERLPAALKALTENLERTGLKEKARVIPTDALYIYNHPRMKNASFELIFADPPYRYLEPGRIRDDFLFLLEELLRVPLLTDDGLIVVGHKNGLLDGISLASGALWDRRKYRMREMSFYSKKYTSA